MGHLLGLPLLPLAVAPFSLAAPPALQDIAFTRVDYATGSGAPGTGATWSVAGDVDGDGTLDLGVANHAGDTLGVLRGAGAGAFGPALPTPTLDGPNAVVFGDVDGDGALDALVGHDRVGRVLVLAGVGDGTFALAGAVSSDVDSRTVALADFDLDGTLDVAVANFDSAEVQIRLGLGTGDFDAPLVHPSGTSPTHLVVGDIDLDGDPDVVASREGEAFNFTPFVLENLGAGSFGQATFSGLTGTPTWVALGELTGDGYPDLAAPTDDSLDVLLETARNDQDNTFTSISFVGLTDMNELGDFNGDGLLDHVYRHWSDNVQIRLGDGTGHTFGELVVPGALAPEHMLVADLDGDGLDDFVTANGGAAGISVFVNETCLAPSVTAVTPTSVPNVTIGDPVQVHIAGQCLQTIDGVLVDGLPLAPGDFTVTGSNEVVVSMPLVPSLGQVPIELSGSLGGVTTSVTGVAATPPVLDLENADPDFLDPVVGLSVVVGGAPASVVVLFASLEAVPSVVPGVLELDIGAAFTALFTLAVVLLDDSGWQEFGFGIDHLPGGLQVHLQAALLAAGPPLVATNAASGTLPN